MRDHTDILIDAIGKVDEKYIEKSVPSGISGKTISERLIHDNGTTVVQLGEAPVRQDNKSRFPVGTAIFTGIAAALIIAAATAAITIFGPGKIDVSGSQGTNTEAITTTGGSFIDITEDPYAALKEKFPEYFRCSAFKGLEVYAWKDSFGLYKFGLMGGTNRNKTDEELDALPPATAEEMREILNYYKEQNGDSETLSVFVIDRDNGTVDDNELRLMLGLSVIDAEPTTTTVPTVTEEYPIEDIRHYRSLENASEQNGLPCLDTDSTESIRGLSGICFQMVQVGDMWVYLTAEDVFADKDDPDLLYGRLEAVMTLPGSFKTNYSVDIVEDIENMEGAIRLPGTDYYVYPFRRSELSNYFYVFGFADDIDSGNVIANVLMTAYGDMENGYRSRFCILKEEGYYGDQVELLGIKDELNATTGTDILLSDDIHWSVPPEMFLIDLKKDLKLTFAPETKIVVVTRASDHTQPDAVIDDEPETTVLPPETDSEDTVIVDDDFVIDTHVHKSFEIQEQCIYKHEPNPGQNIPWRGTICVGGYTYSYETFEISAETFLYDIRDAYVNTDAFKKRISPYCEGDALLSGKLMANVKNAGTPVDFITNETVSGQYFSLGKDYILGTFDNGSSFVIYQRNEKYTDLRKMTEYLWTVFTSAEHPAVVMVMDWDTKSEYLKVIDTQENLDEIQEAFSTLVPDYQTLYMGVTPEQEKASWLPVTSVTTRNDQTDYYPIPDQYNVAFDTGVYSFTAGYRHDQYDQYEDLAQELENLGAVKEAAQFREDLKGLMANGWSFEWVTPYDSLLDPIKLGKRKESYLKITDDIIMVQYYNNNPDDPYPDLGLLTKDTQLTALRRAVNYFRLFPSLNMYGQLFGEYVGEKLIVDWELKTPGSTEPNASFIFIADTPDPEWGNKYDEWAALVKEYLCRDTGIPEDKLTITCDPIDFGDIPTYEPF